MSAITVSLSPREPALERRLEALIANDAPLVVEVEIHPDDERRLRAWADRLNADYAAAGLAADMDLDRDVDLTAAVLACMSMGIRADELEHEIF